MYTTCSRDTNDQQTTKFNVGTVANVATLSVNVTRNSVTKKGMLVVHRGTPSKHVSMVTNPRVNTFTRQHLTQIVVDQTWGTLLTHQVKEKTEIGALTQLHHGDQWL